MPRLVAYDFSFAKLGLKGGGAMIARLRCMTCAHAIKAALKLTFASLTLSASPAFGQADAITIDVNADIAPRCGFIGASPLSATAPRDLESAAQLSFRLKLDCNTPFSFGVTAANGALLNQDALNDGSGFAFAKTYYLSVGIDTDRGVIASERCASSELVTGGTCSFASTVAGEGLSSRNGIAIDRDATLEVEWPDQRELTRRLAPGRYRDTLILVVGPRT
tara:strand:+ start:1675 stop:2337 length:663 start_codon:yes stop_codon:yes gene_type:complete